MGLGWDSYMRRLLGHALCRLWRPVRLLVGGVAADDVNPRPKAFWSAIVANNLQTRFSIVVKHWIKVRIDSKLGEGPVWPAEQDHPARRQLLLFAEHELVIFREAGNARDAHPRPRGVRGRGM